MSDSPVDFDGIAKQALEASLYLSARQPGLQKAELVEILTAFGARRGEAGDSVDALLRSEAGVWPDGRIFFVEEHYPPLAFIFGHTFTDDPRDREAAVFVQRLYKSAAADHGIAKTRIGREQVVAEGRDHGLAIDGLDFGIEVLHRNHLIERIESTHVYKPKDAIRTGAILGEQRGDLPRPRRDFGRIVELVRETIQRRDSTVDGKRLCAALDGIAIRGPRDMQASAFLRFVVARFVDGFKPLLVGDLERSNPDTDVAALVSRLVEDDWLFRPSLADPRALVPTALALTVEPELHPEVLLVLDAVLRRASSLWGDNRERIPFVGPIGLFEHPRRLEELPFKLAQQLLPSLQPAIVLPDSSAQVVELRRELAYCKSLPDFLSYLISARERVVAVQPASGIQTEETADSPTEHPMVKDPNVDHARTRLHELGWVLPEQAKPLAAGGGGAVYKVYRRDLVDAVTRSRDPSTDATYLVEELLRLDPEGSCAALKVAHRFDERLAREIAAMQKIEDPHLVRVLARDDRAQPVWYLMEYIGGGALSARLAEFEGDAAKTLRAIAPVARALGGLHGAALIHRDVKTKNLFLRRNGQLVLGDLGIVFDPNAPRLTTYESPMSRDWVPRWKPDDMDTPQRDVYSLARVIYAMLTGDKIVEPEWLTDAEHQLASIYPHNAAMPFVDELLRGHIVARKASCASANGRTFAEAIETCLEKLETGLQMQPLIYFSSGLTNPGSGQHPSLTAVPIQVPDWARRLTARMRYRHPSINQIPVHYEITLEDGTKHTSERVTLRPGIWCDDLNVSIPKRAASGWSAISVISEYGAVISEFSLHAFNH